MVLHFAREVDVGIDPLEDSASGTRADCDRTHACEVARRCVAYLDCTSQPVSRPARADTYRQTRTMCQLEVGLDAPLQFMHSDGVVESYDPTKTSLLLLGLAYIANLTHLWDSLVVQP